MKNVFYKETVLLPQAGKQTLNTKKFRSAFVTNLKDVRHFMCKPFVKATFRQFVTKKLLTIRKVSRALQQCKVVS